MTTAASQAAIVPPGGGRSILGMLATAKVPSDAFEGRLFVFEGVLEPGAFIPPHTHSLEDEVTFILSGALTFELGGSVSRVDAGSFVIKPRGAHHAFWNHTDEPARVLELNIPGRLEPYYDALGALFSAANLGDPDRAAAGVELSARYGIIHHTEMIAEFVATHGAGRRPAPTS